MDKKFRLKRIIIATIVLVLFVAYWLGTDPDTKFFQNIPFGVGLVLTLGAFIIAAVGVWFLEIIPDYFLDYIYGKERDLVEVAKQTSEGAGKALIAKSIRILAFAIVLAAAIIAKSVG